LTGVDDTDRANYIKYGYREVIKEDLKEMYSDGNKWL
jgi:hypothetical protein